MASADTHTTIYYPEIRQRSEGHSPINRLGKIAARLIRIIADADETRHALRRRRYAALLR
jgi:hypothetical protein